MAETAKRPRLHAESFGIDVPVETALVRLRRYGFGERVLKSAIAAGAAWFIANLIHTSPVPVLAPVTAMFTIQPTVVRSVSGSIQRMLGVVCGVSTALVLGSLIGVHWWTISLVVALCLAAGIKIFGLEQAGVEQMTVSALLVMIVGASGDIFNVASYHILDTVIGTIVGVAANAAIAPPNHLPRAQRAIHELGSRLSAVLSDLSVGFAYGLDRDQAADVLRYARAVAAGLDEVQDALDAAEESLKFNFVRRRQEPAFNRYRRANRALEHAAVQVRVISRTVSDGVSATPSSQWQDGWLGIVAVSHPLSELFAAIERYLGSFLAVVEDPAGLRDDQLILDEIQQRRSDVSAAMNYHIAALMPDRWVLAGEVVSIANQLVTDLSTAAEELRRTPALAFQPRHPWRRSDY